MPSHVTPGHTTPYSPRLAKCSTHTTKYKRQGKAGKGGKKGTGKKGHQVEATGVFEEAKKTLVLAKKMLGEAAQLKAELEAIDKAPDIQDSIVSFFFCSVACFFDIVVWVDASLRAPGPS